MSEVTLEQVYAVQLAIKAQCDKMEAHLDKLNGRVGGLDVRVAVIEEWKRCVGEPSARDTGDLKVALAKLLAIGGGIGGGGGLIFLLVKSVLG